LDLDKVISETKGMSMKEISMKEDRYWIWITRIKNVKKSTIKKLINKYKTPEKIYNLKYTDLIENEISKIEIEELQNEEYKANIDKYIEYMQKNEIEIISINNTRYPQKLKTLSDPPLVIFAKGNIKVLENKGIAIVGCRDASMYGKTVADKISYNLAKRNINIISGLAVGIDSYAHIGAIKNNEISGKTIAVIGNGLDDIYPKENKILAEKIIETGGVIISEYLIGTKPDKMNFPARNRIISALSEGVLVIEAKEKSGTLITVDFALEQGKDVFAIPGNITSFNSYGTNKLLREGAIIITDITGEEILETIERKTVNEQ